MCTELIEEELELYAARDDRYSQIIRDTIERECVNLLSCTYTLAGPPELRWGNLKGMSA
jgi:hypothetical protein